jgi:hypothetical protein
MMASIVLASMTTVDTAAVLVSISNRSEEGNGSETLAGSDIEDWIYAVASMLWMMASIILASMTTIDMAAVLVSISNRSKEGNRSETSTGSDIEG